MGAEVADVPLSLVQENSLVLHEGCRYVVGKAKDDKGQRWCAVQVLTLDHCLRMGGLGRWLGPEVVVRTMASNLRREE
jgi:hypothetical protein